METNLGKHRLRPSPEKRPAILPIGNRNRVRIHRATSFRSDEPKGALERHSRHPFSSSVTVDEEASDPPIRKVQPEPAVDRHSARKFGRGTELAPTQHQFAIVNKGGMGSAGLHESALERSSFGRGLVRMPQLEVELYAPASAPDAPVLLSYLCEIVPIPGSEFDDGQRQRGAAMRIPYLNRFMTTRMVSHL
jgi:hypothetical protein